jgi:hypothetical protein
MFFFLFSLFSTTWTFEDCPHADALQVNEVTTTTEVLARQQKAARRVEGRAVTRPSDSLGWPEGAKGIRDGPEFHSCSSEKSYIRIIADIASNSNYKYNHRGNSFCGNCCKLRFQTFSNVLFIFALVFWSSELSTFQQLRCWHTDTITFGKNKTHLTGTTLPTRIWLSFLPVVACDACLIVVEFFLDSSRQ